MKGFHPLESGNKLSNYKIDGFMVDSQESPELTRSPPGGFYRH